MIFGLFVQLAKILIAIEFISCIIIDSGISTIKLEHWRLKNVIFIRRDDVRS